MRGLLLLSAFHLGKEAVGSLQLSRHPVSVLTGHGEVRHVDGSQQQEEGRKYGQNRCQDEFILRFGHDLLPR